MYQSLEFYYYLFWSSSVPYHTAVYCSLFEVAATWPESKNCEKLALHVSFFELYARSWKSRSIVKCRWGLFTLVVKGCGVPVVSPPLLLSTLEKIPCPAPSTGRRRGFLSRWWTEFTLNQAQQSNGYGFIPSICWPHSAILIIPYLFPYRIRCILKSLSQLNFFFPDFFSFFFFFYWPVGCDL
jgi:hypothetical protein